MDYLIPGRLNQRLDSWKSIADYLSRDVRTVIRWEKERGLPVHRVPGGKKQAVFAFTEKLDAWLLSGVDDAPPSRGRTLAVLPFANQCGDPEFEYLADGLTESVISRLSQIPSLRVLARSTVFRYRGPNVDVLAAARELKAPMAVSGVLRSRADELQVSVELLNTNDGSQVWGVKRTEPLSNPWALEGKLAENIARELHVRLNGDERSRLTRLHTDDPEAMQLYWRSRYEFYKFSEEGIKTAMAMLQRAIARDPMYAKAHAALADCYSYLAFGYSSECPPRHWIKLACEAAQTAISLDESLAEAHVALALALPQLDLKLDMPEREFVRALELNPSLSQAHTYYSYLLLARRRFDEMAAHVTASVDLDPFSPAVLADGAALLGFAGRVDEALALADRSLSLGEPHAGPLYIAGFLHQMKGDYDRAIELLERAVQLTVMHTVPLGILGYLYAITGKPAKAQEIVTRLHNISKLQPAANFSLAIAYCGLGEKENALVNLEKAAEERISWMILVHIVPWFKSLRNEPRFQDLVHRLELD
jgi:TolB-like protein/Flp pilus assembly protein TadD